MGMCRPTQKYTMWPSEIFLNYRNYNFKWKSLPGLCITENGIGLRGLMFRQFRLPKLNVTAERRRWQIPPKTLICRTYLLRMLLSMAGFAHSHKEACFIQCTYYLSLQVSNIREHSLVTWGVVWGFRVLLGRGGHRFSQHSGGKGTIDFHNMWRQGGHRFSQQVEARGP